MLPKQRLNKIKTFKDKNPLNSRLDIKVIDEFINQQTKMIDFQRNLTTGLNDFEK